MTKNMTQGNPVKLIISFAFPLLLGNLLQQMYNIIDAAIVGRILGADALAAVGSSSSVQFLVLGFGMGVCAGFGVPIARYFGAGDIKKLRSIVFNAYIISVLIAALMCFVTTRKCDTIMMLMKTPADIYDDAYEYLFIIFCAIPFLFAYNLFASMLRALGDSKSPFIFLAISTFSNIILDIVFIVVFHAGCAGAALATAISQGISVVLCFVYILVKFPLLKPDRECAHISFQSLWELFYMGIPMGLQYSITAIGCMVMQSQNNNLGSVYVSAFAAGSKIKQFSLCPYDAIATGVTVFCGQNLGAGNIARIKKGIKTGIAIVVSYGAFIGIILCIFGRTLSMLFVEEGETAVLDASAQYLRCLGYFFWFLGILNICRMTIQGLGFSAIAIFSGITELFARFFVSLYFVPRFGFTAICFTDQTAWVSATIYCSVVLIIILKKIEKRLQNSSCGASLDGGI